MQRIRWWLRALPAEHGSNVAQAAAVALLAALLIGSLLLSGRSLGPTVSRAMSCLAAAVGGGGSCAMGTPAAPASGTAAAPGGPTGTSPGAGETAASVGLDFIPVVGEIKGLIEVFTGKDLVTGEDLGWWRFAGLAGLVGFNEIKHLRHADDVVEAVGGVGRRGDELVDTGRGSVRLTGQQDEAAALIRKDPCISSMPMRRLSGLGAPLLSNKCDFPPGSPEHKQQRWEEYQALDKQDKLSYEQWSNVYESNMRKARESSEAVKAYRNQLNEQGGNWTDYEKTVDVDGNGTQRRLDIANVAEKRAIEHKKYNQGTVYNDESIRWEVERDAKLVKDDWEIEWVFEGCEPSGPLREALEQAGISIRIIK